MRCTNLLVIVLAGLFLLACQNQGPQPLRPDPGLADDNPSTAPLVDVLFNGFNAETTTLRFSEGETIEFEIDNITAGVQNTSLTQTSGPRVNFGNFRAGGMESDGDINTASGSTPVRFTLSDVEGPRVATIDPFDRLRVDFVAPSVTRRTTLNFQFRSSGTSGARTRNIPVIIEDNTAALTLTGQVSKGLVKDTRIRLFSVDQFNIGFGGNRELVEPVQIDDTGRYSFTVLPATDFEDLLRFEVKGDGADMICDAPRGCNTVDFGATFEVEDDLDLRALIEVPSLGTTRTANVNILTTLVAKRAGQLNGFRRVSPGDVRDGREDVASVFGLREQDYSTLPFIDVTQRITSTNEDAVRAAIFAGGVMGAIFLQSDPDDPDDYLEELDDFIDNFGDREIFCRDTPTQTTISVEDIMQQALEIAQINGSLSTRNFFLAQLTNIRSGVFRCEFETPPDPE